MLLVSYVFESVSSAFSSASDWMKRAIFQSLLHRLRPATTEFSLKAWFIPAERPLKMPSRKASEPYLVTKSIGLITLPLDLLIF